LAEVCRRHSRVALKVAEDTLLELLELQLGRLAASLGLDPDPVAVVEALESRPELLTEELLAKVWESSKLVRVSLAPLVGWVARRGRLTYEEALEVARECGLETTYALLRAYPNIGRSLIGFLNVLAERVRGSGEVVEGVPGGTGGGS